MVRTFTCFALFVVLAGCAATTDRDSLPGRGDDLGKIVVYRDTWGVAHIYAPTIEDGLYAMGRAQAEDRPEQLLTNLKMALGEYASVVGRDALKQDITTRLFDHYGIAKRTFDLEDEQTRRHTLAYAQGVMDHYRLHPEDVPASWGTRKLDVYMFGAFARFFLYNWSIDEAYGDLRRGGIEAGAQPPPRASNQFTISGSRTTSGNPILVADPHLSWWGVTRFWEVRLHAGELEGSGVTLPGSPYIGLGHNRDVAWAMTTGGPDTADVYELRLDPADHTRYLYEGKWRDLVRTTVTIAIRDASPETVTLYRSHQGPIIGWNLKANPPRAYAARIAYDDSVNPRTLTLSLNLARDYRGAVEGLDALGTFPQNVMVADTSGNIYYQRAGRVPNRPQGFDWSRPVDGSTSATDWHGFHPASELVQILNPPQGYMQNCNIPPDAMMVASPLQPEDFLPEIFSSAQYGPSRSGWINQRGARALELLSHDDEVTVEDAMAVALDVKPYGIERWIEALGMSVPGRQLTPAQQDALGQVLRWNGELRRDSAPALKYAYFRFQLAKHMDDRALKSLREKVDQWYLVATGATPKRVTLTEDEASAIADSFIAGVEQLRREFPKKEAVYGDVFRVGRDDRSWPLGGGGGDQFGLTTLRTVSYGEPAADHTRRGVSGQTSTQVIQLSEPIRSWMYIPVGESDRPDSPHYTDQAEKLFSPRRLKPTWWLPEDLQPNIESRTVYER